MQIFFRNLIALMGRKPQFVVIALVTIITVGFIGGARHYAEEARIQAAYDTAKSLGRFYYSVSSILFKSDRPADRSCRG